MTAPTHIYFQGSIVPAEQAKVSVMTHAFNYGTGVFEGIRGYWNAAQGELYLLKLREHFERLQQSAKLLRMNIDLSLDELCEITLELMRLNQFRQDIYVRPVVYKSDELIGVRLHKLTDGLTIFGLPMGEYLPLDRGIKCCFSSWRRLDDNMIPARAKCTGAYVNSALAKTEAYMNGYDEAIFLDSSGHVSEGSAANLFMIRKGKLITPGVTCDILEGITRQEVINMARTELGLEVIERQIDRTELMVADEVFLVGTGVQIAAVTSISQMPVGNGEIGPLTRALRDVYFSAVKGELDAYRHWLTPVYQRSAVPAK